MSPKKPGEESYGDLLKILADHFSPAPLEIVQRFKFNSRLRKPGESVSTYVAELRAIAEFCNFNDTLEDMLRDRLVCGINDSAIQRRLLAESKLTFQQALGIARGLEVAAQNVKELKPARGPDGEGLIDQPVCNVTSTNKPSRSKFISGSKADVVCYRCGKSGHYVSKCRVSRDVTCHQCGKTGHLKKACQGGKQKGKSQFQSVRHVEDESEEFPVFHIGMNSKTPPYEVTVQMDGSDVTMEVDTGSSVSVISKETYERLWSGRELSWCKYRLRSYLEEPIAVLGCLDSEVVYKSQTVRLPLIIVDGNRPSLLGRNWLEHIVLDWHEICHVSCTPLQSVLDKHQEVFQKGLGTLKNFKAKIHVDPDAAPRFCKATVCNESKS